MSAETTDDVQLLTEIHTALEPTAGIRVASWRVESTIEIPGPRKRRLQAFADLLNRTLPVSRFFFAMRRVPNRQGNVDNAWIRRPIDMEST